MFTAFCGGEKNSQFDFQPAVLINILKEDVSLHYFMLACCPNVVP